jgi:hypothetical protein
MTVNRYLIHLRLYKLGFLISEVAGDGGSVVAVADGNDLAVGLNEHSVSKGYAAAEWRDYKAAVTERRVDLSVGSIARQAEIGRTGVAESGLSNRHNVAICLECDREGLSEDIAREWCCNAAMAGKAVIDRAVAVVAHQEESRSAAAKYQARRSNEAAGGDDLGDIGYRVGSNDKSARAVGSEARSLSMNAEPSVKAAIRPVEGCNAAIADQNFAIRQKPDRFAADSGGCAIRAKGRIKLAIREQARNDASGSDENLAVRLHGHTSTSWRKEESSCFDGYNAVAPEGVVRAAVSIEAENREAKIIGSRRENFPIRLNGYGKRGAGVITSDHHLAAAAEIRIERTIGVVTQEARLLLVLTSWDRPGYHDLAVALEGCSIGARVCRSDDTVDAESRVQSPGLGHQQVG